MAALPPTAEELRPFDSEAEYGPIADVSNDDLDENDMIALLDAAIKDTRLIGHTIDSYDEFLGEGIEKIVTGSFKINTNLKNHRQTAGDGNDAIEHYNLQVDFTGAKIGFPTQAAYPSGKISDLWPCQARNSERSYTAPLRMSARIKVTAHFRDGTSASKESELKEFEVSQIPMMVRSSHCRTRGLSHEELKLNKEDPNDFGGYLIAGGLEKVINLLENIRFNSLHIHRAMGTNEVVRGEFISQPGGAFENSSQVILRHHIDDTITVEINSTKLQKHLFPLAVIFRLFGVASDAEIAADVVPDWDPAGADPAGLPKVERDMLRLVDQALKTFPAAYEDLAAELDRDLIIDSLARRIGADAPTGRAYRDDVNAIRFLANSLLDLFDRTLLPHMGQDATARRAKLRFLGLLLRKTLLVELGVAPPSDRDSLIHKRIHGAGVSMAKTFKQMFNAAVVRNMIAAMRSELKQTSFSALTAGRIQEAGQSVASSNLDLKRLLDKSLKSGAATLTVNRKAFVNRTPSQAYEIKNQLNALAAHRAIATHGGMSASKGTERAESIRAVQPTFLGYICPDSSADSGEKVGMVKQLACTATVCRAGGALPLAARLLGSGLIRPTADVTNLEIARENLARVFVNGDWVGCTADPAGLAAHFRGLRRRGLAVGRHTTVAWELGSNEVFFWLDVGRLMRPLLIVDNNLAAYEAGIRAKTQPPPVFVQNVRFTRADARALERGELDLDALVRRGAIEFIAPEEMENCFLAEDIDKLRAERHNQLLQYTHCDVPQAILGLVAMTSVYAGHTQPARVCYQTNQARQTCGWYSLAWPFRADQLRFFQVYNERPLVRTLAQNYVAASGINTMVAYMPFRGNNQEDSIIASLASVQRGMFFGWMFSSQRATLDKGESFGTPDPATTRGMKPHAAYGHLVDGFVPVGATVHRGDALVGRLAREGAAPVRGAAAETVDRSLIYQGERAEVDAVWVSRSDHGETGATIKLRYPMPLNVGDKASSRAGNKGIISFALPVDEMPYDDDGYMPDLIINPHSQPTRMTVGQLIETTVGLACGRTGSSADGTAFRRLDLDAVADQLERLGFRRSGHRTLYNPESGEPFEAAIFMGMTYHQRLQKFVNQNTYVAPAFGATDAITGQPLDGKKVSGGLRQGEMEVWVYLALGAMATCESKIRDDSDGMQAFYCRRCGLPAVLNRPQAIYRCAECGPMAEIAEVPSCRAALALQHELRAVGVDVRMELEGRLYE